MDSLQLFYPEVRDFRDEKNSIGIFIGLEELGYNYRPKERGSSVLWRFDHVSPARQAPLIGLFNSWNDVHLEYKNRPLVLHKLGRIR